MSDVQLRYAQRKLAAALFVIVFPFALIAYLFSGCDLRQRSGKRACRNGSADQCLAVGQFYESRTDGLMASMLSNATTAKNYYDRACKLGNRAGCARFGHMVVVGSYGAIRDDSFTHDDGMTALGTACDGGDTTACRELGDAADSAHAAPVFAKLCDAGDKPSCNKAITAYLDIDPKRATELRTRMCDAGDTDQCRELGTSLLAGSNADPAQGTAILGKACDHEAWEACRELADAYLDGRLPPDAEQATKLLARACDHNDPDACFELGKTLLDSDPARSVKAFTGECDGGDDRGCDALGDLARVGASGIERDRNRAYSFYDRACRHGSDFDCYKRNCMNADSDACYKVHTAQGNRTFRLGGVYDMR